MLFAISLGVVAGIFSGVIPAVGNFTVILLFMPFLFKLGVFDIIVFYMTMTSISQYVCSIPSILFGIPGETSSIPVVQESKFLSWREKIEALRGCAYGSFVGTTLTFSVILVFSKHIEALILPLFSSHMLATMLWVSVIAICIFSNKIHISAINAFIGAGLALIGFNTFFDINLSFGTQLLIGGIPEILVITLLLGLPELYQNFKIHGVKNTSTDVVQSKTPYIVLPKWYVSLGSTILGAVGGLVPGLTFIASSTIAYSAAKLAKLPGLQRIYASETANNAGSVTQLLPLLLFAIPISGAEALIFLFLSQQGFSVHTYSFADIYNHIGITFIAINVIGLCITLYLSKIIAKVQYVNIKNIAFFTGFALVSSLVYVGISRGLLLEYGIIALGLLPLAWVLRNTNNMPLVFVFLVFDKLVESSYRIFIL